MYAIALGSIWLCLCLSAVIEVYLPGNKRVKYSKFIYIFISGIMIATAAFRYEIGYDFRGYENIFSVVAKNGDASLYELKDKLNLEIGFLWLNRLLPSFQMLIFVLAVGCVGTKLHYIRKYSSCCLLTMMLYYCGLFLNYDMGVLRQAVAISFFFVVIDCLNKDRLKLAVFFTLLSSLFHITSLVYVSLIILADKKISRRSIYMIICGVSILAALTNVSDMVIAALTKMGIGIVSSKLEFYMMVEENGAFLASYIKRVAYLIMFTEFYEKHNADKSQRIFYNSFFLSVILMGLFSKIQILGGRGVIALSFAQNFMLADMYSKSRNDIFRLFLLALCISTALVSMNNIVSFGNASGQRYTPYTTIYDYGLSLF